MGTKCRALPEPLRTIRSGVDRVGQTRCKSQEGNKMNDDRINEHYFGDLSDPMVQRCRERIHWICKQATGQKVLDIGCSQGIVSLILGREGFECTGVDIEPGSLDFARKQLKKEDEIVRKRVKFRLADASGLPFR